MKIDPRNLEVGPIALKVTLPAEMLELQDPLIRPKSEIQVDLEVFKDGDNIVARGVLGTQVEMRCSRCGDWMPWAVDLPEFEAIIEPPFPEFIDLTSYVREDIVLALPFAPSCRLDGMYRCPVTGECFPPEAEKPVSLGTQQAWDALDNLKLKE